MATYIVGKVTNGRICFGLVEADNPSAAYALACSLPAQALGMSLEHRAYMWAGVR